MAESHNVEYKQSWRDEYLKWFSGFANAQGGKIYIGIDDHGNVTGVDEYKKLMDDIPNKAVSHLGLVVDVNLHKTEGKHFIEIYVPVSKTPISYHGVYHYRSGSTKQELKGDALNQFLVKKLGISWEQRPMSQAVLEDIDENAIQSFIKKALDRQRISESARTADTLTILKNLDLISVNGDLLLAALLLFGKKPSKWALSAVYRIGRFSKSPSDLRFQDIIEGNILDMADEVIRKLDDRYLIRPISYKGLQRIEGLEYPESALREGILNSIIHKNYGDNADIFLKVYDDRLTIWNSGTLPENWTIEYLKGDHVSEPRNKLIAKVFFMAGYIESWGRGVNLIFQACKDYGIPEPSITQEASGLKITFLKDIYTEENLSKLDINERQVKALLYVKEHGQITNSAYQKINNIGKSITATELLFLVERKLLSRVGITGRGTKYILFNE
ncbi:MAG: transcriptional regulator [Pedobacter sp.]|nr:MAG: transcriptional regulator [Pedobacter sp.]